MANSKIKLIYYDLPVREEILRLILTHADKKFEDSRFSRDKWPEIKPTTPFGQVPCVDIDGKTYAQTVAIANYLAREFNLYGKTNLDGLKIDQLVHVVEDLVQEVFKYRHEHDEAKKAELEKKVKEESVPKYLGFIERLLGENKGQYLLGDDCSLGDLVVYDVVTGFMSTFTAPAVDKYPLTKAVAEKIGNHEGIKAYKAKHH